jgi:hypothetical protein
LEINLKVNNFAIIERLEEFTFEKVKYYSIRFHENENEVNEFYDFLNRMEDIPEIESDLSNLYLWIEEIGQYHGAKKERFFRHEGRGGEAYALPPPSKTMEIYEIVVEEHLRLYCMVANEHVVILFNGGIKTTKYPQDCPNVGPFFKQANNLTKKIDKLFQEKSIRWNDDFTDINFDSSLTIEL